MFRWLSRLFYSPPPDDWVIAPKEGELESLRRRNSRGRRALIAERLQHLSPKARPIDPADKLKIFRDVLTELSSSWLPQLQLTEAEWYPNPYQKNLLGQLIAMAEKVAPSSLDSAGLTQLVAGIDRSLGQLVPTLNPSLSLKLSLETAVPIVRLWTETAIRVQRKGDFPIDTVTIKPQPTARYIKENNKPSSLISPEEWSRRRALLEQNLNNR